MLDDELAEEVMDAQETAELETVSLASEELAHIRFPPAEHQEAPRRHQSPGPKSIIQDQRQQGCPQVMVLTRYTDIMDFLRLDFAQIQGTVLHYENTVEAHIDQALRIRIQLFCFRRWIWGKAIGLPGERT